MEHKNIFAHRVIWFRSLGTQQNWFRLFVVLTIILAVLFAYAFDRLQILQKKYDDLARRHNRLNKIYLEEKQR